VASLWLGACGLALSSYSSSRTGNLRQVTCCLAKTIYTTRALALELI